MADGETSVAERLTFRRWAILRSDGTLADLFYEHEPTLYRSPISTARAVRVTVTVDPPRRRAGKAGKR